MTEHESHPSFGTVRISRGTICGSADTKGATLVGSNLKHRHVISLEISTATKNRSFNNDYFHVKEQVVEVVMSESQFGALLSSMNVGEGVPCTIQRVMGRTIEAPPDHNHFKLVEENFEEHTKVISKKLSELLKAFQIMISPQGKITKTELIKLTHDLELTVQDIEKNLPFVDQTFRESMEKSVLQAKAEVEGYVMRRMVELANRAAKQLEESSTEPALIVEIPGIESGTEVEG